MVILGPDFVGLWIVLELDVPVALFEVIVVWGLKLFVALFEVIVVLRLLVIVVLAGVIHETISVLFGFWTVKLSLVVIILVPAAP